MVKVISQWFTKKTLYYVIAWMVISFVLMFTSYDRNTPILPQWIGFMVVTGLAIPVCNYSVYKLVPNYLYKRKIVRFIISLLGLALANAVVTVIIALFIYHLVSGNPFFRSVAHFLTVYFASLIVDLILIIVSCIVKIITDRYYMEQQMLQIEKEKVSTELNFLRSQVNPHFLFNVMNTIYFQIDKANTDARLSVEKLSEMLRYQLYECTTDKIQINKELHYIENYVSIQTLRMEKESDIRLYIDRDMGNFTIAPLLILPLVENAFKHVSNFKDANKNLVQLTIKTEGINTLVIEVLNTYDQATGQKHLLQSGGLGIQNLKRRLELLYPGKYELSVDKGADIFQTTLKLQYND